MKHLFFLTAVLLSSLTIRASHMVAGEIGYKHLSGLDYEVSLKLYVDCMGSVTMSPVISVIAESPSNGFYIDSSLSATIMGLEVSNVCPSQLLNTTCNGNSIPGVKLFVYQGVISLPIAADDWVFYYDDCCRNGSITNISNPSFFGMRVSAYLDATVSNSSPEFPTLILPTIYANTPFNYSYSGLDADGDSLAYTLTAPLDYSTGIPISYVAPYSGSYPLSTTTGSVSFDALTATLSFTANAVQVTVVGILVEEYRNGVLVGSVRRDIQIMVVSGTDAVPQIGPLTNVTGGTAGTNNSITALAGSPISFEFSAWDADAADSVSLSDSQLSDAGFSISQSGSNPAVFTVSGTPNLGSGTFSIPITIKDNHCPIYLYNSFTLILAISDCGFTISEQIANVCAGDSAFVAIDGPPTNSYVVVLPSGSFSFTDDFSLLLTGNAGYTYSVTATGTGGCTTVQNAVFNVDTSCVWPGDCNYDGVVAMDDALAIGVGFGMNGPIRPDASIVFLSQYAENWNQTYITDDYKHIDTDGNGGINHDDTLAIAVNLGAMHLKYDETWDLNDSIPALSLVNEKRIELQAIRNAVQIICR